MGGMAVTNTREPGYSLYIPSEFALQIYDNLIKGGRDYGIRNVGHLAMRFLRIEKFIPFWAEELTSETTPNEVNRTFKVKFDKKSFTGKEALLKQKEEGVTKRLIQFHLEDFDKDSDIWPWAGESIYRDAGQGEGPEFVGSVTSSAFGFTMQKMLALGFVHHPNHIRGERTLVEPSWIIDIAGSMVPVSVHLHPPKIPIVSQEGVAADYKPKKNQSVPVLKEKAKAAN